LPDQAEAMVQYAIEQLSLPSPDGRPARLYQHVDDPTWLLQLAEWSSREAFEAHRQADRPPGTPEQLQRLAACRLYQRLALFERVLTPVPALHLHIVEGPARTHARRRDLALAYHRSRVRGRPGLVLLQVYEAVDGGPGLLVISGWETIALLQQAAEDQDRAILDAASGGTARRFVGQVLADTTDP
jgi:hypothetical protein